MRRTRLNPISRKRARQLAKRAVVRQDVLERDGGCVAAWLLAHIDCGGPLDVHELVRRSQDPTAWLNPDKCVVLCRRHHEFVTAHPQQGHDVGLVRWSWEQEGT